MQPGFSLPTLGGNAATIETGIVAAPEGGPENARRLTATYNFLEFVAVNDDSVLLPAASPGEAVWVINEGVATARVFAASGGDVGGAGAGIGYGLAPAGAMLVVLDNQGDWRLLVLD